MYVDSLAILLLGDRFVIKSSSIPSTWSIVSSANAHGLELSILSFCLQISVLVLCDSSWRAIGF